MFTFLSLFASLALCVLGAYVCVRIARILLGWIAAVFDRIDADLRSGSKKEKKEEKDEAAAE